MVILMSKFRDKKNSDDLERITYDFDNKVVIFTWNNGTTQIQFKIIKDINNILNKLNESNDNE